MQQIISTLFMKMKKIPLGFSILAVSALLVLGCNKKDNVAPEPDTEFQSSIDISYAHTVITDIDMICSYVGENNLSPKFYLPVPGGTGTITVTRDTVLKYLIVSYNKTTCMDGRVRDGSIFMNYAFSNPNAKYYRDFEFQGKVSLTNYKVDGWKVSLKNSFIITNKVTPSNYNPKTTNLSWSMTGDFVLKHPNANDSAKNMHCNVNFVKTLTGTSNPTIFPISKQAAINWSLATVAYTGSSWGETSRTVPYTFVIADSKPLIRDFTCFPDKISGITLATNSVTPQYEEYHPFVNGDATFTTGNLYPRVIHYGPEDSTTPLQCDNEGIVTIKGNSYPVNFVKEYK